VVIVDRLLTARLLGSYMECMIYKFVSYTLRENMEYIPQEIFL